MIMANAKSAMKNPRWITPSKNRFDGLVLRINFSTPGWDEGSIGTEVNSLHSRVEMLLANEGGLALEEKKRGKERESFAKAERENRGVA
jgi:hypothetical protein